MATRYAVATGLWSDVNTWDGTTTTPATGDTVVANTFTVTIDTNVTVVQIQNTALGGGAALGNFVLNNNITLTANVACGTVTCLTFSATTGTIIGNATNNGSSGASAAISNTGTGTLTITGNVTGGTGNASGTVGISNTSSGIINLTGNAVGGGSNICYGALNNSTGTINVTGTATPSTANGTGHGIQNASTGTINLTGNLTGSATVANPFCINNASTGTINITGNVTGGLAGIAIKSTTAGNIIVVGTITASTLTAISSSATAGYNNLTGPFVDSSTGIVAAYCYTLALSPSSTISTTNWKFAQAGASAPNYNGYRFMYTAGVSIGNPTAANVRSGTAFGANNELTGTMAIPNPAYVSIGVSTDNTVGTMNPLAPIVSTTIATLASQTSFTLTAGSTDNNAYNGQIIIITQNGSTTRKAIGTIQSYTGATKTVTLTSNPSIFTMATGDSVSINLNSTNNPSFCRGIISGNQL